MKRLLSHRQKAVKQKRTLRRVNRRNARSHKIEFAIEACKCGYTPEMGQDWKHVPICGPTVRKRINHRWRKRHKVGCHCRMCVALTHLLEKQTGKPVTLAKYYSSEGTN